MTLVLGCIADDFTGATDLANTLARGGLATVQLNGVPAVDRPVPPAEALVVALKSRTAPVAEAVDRSLRALAWLRAHGAPQILFKVCSTFDSTDAGNIGPVADALAEALGARITIVCPAFPANGRTVYQGHLFVGSQLLSDSPMRDHPLTPMCDADLVRVLGRQSSARVGLVPWSVVTRGDAAVRDALQALQRNGFRHAIADALSDADLRTLGRAARDLPLLVGGSGIALGLPDNARAQGLVAARDAVVALPRGGAALALAGSCSQATRAQVDRFAQRHPARRVDPAGLLSGDAELTAALGWMRAQLPNGRALLYSSAAPDEIEALASKLGADGRARASAAIEHAFGAIARAAVDAGVQRLIVAGGETSGAVVQALGVDALAIGPEIDPGVPWTVVPGRPLALALKSGNFGAPDFFDKALALSDA
jgi:uncharacterized protein YgbK (DUF1537 family)